MVVLNVSSAFDLFRLYFFILPWRTISTLRYKPLPACITLPSSLKTAPTKLVVINRSSNPDLPVNTQLWSTVTVQSTILSTNLPHLHRIHSTQQSPTNGNNEERSFCHCYKWDLWGLLHLWPWFQELLQDFQMLGSVNLNPSSLKLCRIHLISHESQKLGDRMMYDI